MSQCLGISPSSIEAATSAPPLSRQLLDCAKLVVAGCQKGQITATYSHENICAKDHLRCNCYGFLRYLLQNVYPAAYDSVARFMHESRDQIPVSFDDIPCPFHYRSFFASIADHPDKYWESIADARSLQPGDIIGYLPLGYVPKVITEMPASGTGTHIMLVEYASRPQEDEIHLTVIHCSRHTHDVQGVSTQAIGRAHATVFLGEGQVCLRWGTENKKQAEDLFFGRLRD